MNKVFLIGRVIKDPEYDQRTEGFSRCNLGIVVNRPFSRENRQQTQDNKQLADVIYVTLWNNQAKAAVENLKVGRQVAIEGRIQTNKYEKEGKTVYSTQIVASNIEYLGSKDDKKAESSNYSNMPNQEEGPFGAYEPEMDTTSVDNDIYTSFGEKVEINDEELPF